MIKETLRMLACNGQAVLASYLDPIEGNNGASTGVPVELDGKSWSIGKMEFRIDCVRSIEVVDDAWCIVNLLGYRSII